MPRCRSKNLCDDCGPVRCEMESKHGTTHRHHGDNPYRHGVYWIKGNPRLVIE
jgi:hypothetical protein